ncbi:tyrosine-type recombinase/integrase [Aliivibrio logei]|uniref:Integrase n=1 Tax=Aliivibrio logei TaxID=688 RepID=A0A1B9NTU3_ALILO|nr:tyrosine-type recombinase/integrase [Aliivibrio logei]OCH17115.1 integrase [Aliivibrio logei]
MNTVTFLNDELTIQELQSILKKDYSDNSLVSFKNDWVNFVHFCQLHQVNALPASTTAIRIFIEKQAKEKKMSSIRRSLISISHIHIAFEFKDPTKNAQVKASLGSIRLAKKDDSKQTEGITSQMLKKLEYQLSESVELKDIRDLAIWHLMFELLLKRGELRDLKVTDVSFNDEGLGLIKMKEYYYPLSIKISQLLTRWLEASQILEGYLFRSMDRHENLSLNHLNDSSIYRIFRRANILLNHTVNFSGLSARVGATKELSKKGYSIQEIQEMGRWISPAMPNQYIGQTKRSEEQKKIFQTKKSPI